MAPRRVIDDSEDDGDGLSAENSPEKLAPTVQAPSIDLSTSALISPLQNGTGSTGMPFTLATNIFQLS